MTHLIDKDALVAEIEKKRDKAYPNSDWNHGYVTACEKILSFLDTLEVKEVNSFNATVCKIDNTYLKEMDRDAIVKALESYKDGDKVKVIIKAQKGE